MKVFKKVVKRISISALAIGLLTSCGGPPSDFEPEGVAGSTEASVIVERGYEETVNLRPAGLAKSGIEVFETRIFSAYVDTVESIFCSCSEPFVESKAGNYQCEGKEPRCLSIAREDQEVWLFELAEIEASIGFDKSGSGGYGLDVECGGCGAHNDECFCDIFDVLDYVNNCL